MVNLVAQQDVLRLHHDSPPQHIYIYIHMMLPVDGDVDQKLRFSIFYCMNDTGGIVVITYYAFVIYGWVWMEHAVACFGGICGVEVI